MMFRMIQWTPKILNQNLQTLKKRKARKICRKRMNWKGIWIKKNSRSGGNFWGMGAYTRANAEVCLLGVSPGFRAKDQIRSHRVHQVIEAPFEGHSKKPAETRRRIVELLGDVPRLEMFARDRAQGWDAWGNEAPEE